MANEARLRGKSGKFVKKHPKPTSRRKQSVEIDHLYETAHLCVGSDCEFPECPLNNSIRFGKNVSRDGWREGRRIVEFGVLLSNLESCRYCGLGPVPLSVYSVVGEMQRGLGGYLYVKCDNIDCGKINIVSYGKTHRDKNSKGIPNFVANTKLGLAMIDVLGGPDRVNNFLSTMNIKPINHKNLKVFERRAGKYVEAVADKTTTKACDQSFSAEMEEIAEKECNISKTQMLKDLIDEDLQISFHPDASPSVRNHLTRRQNVDGILSSDEEEQEIANLNTAFHHTPEVTVTQSASPSTPANSKSLTAYIHKTPNAPPRDHKSHSTKGNGRVKTRLVSKYPCKTRTGMSCAVDTAWHKRGFDSLTSHTFFMSKAKYGKKVVKTMVSHRTCGTCKWWAKNRPFQKVRKHRCVFNHSGSARLMESTSGVKAMKELSKSGFPVEFLEGDGDNTLIARLKEENINVKKRYDRNHVVKNIGKKLYSLQKTHKKLSKSVILHLQKCIKYAFAKNQGNSSTMKNNLQALIPHQFGDHTLCEASFCGFCRNKDQPYKHVSLPYKAPLKDENLRSELLHIMEPVIANAEQYSDLGSSQQCEHANREVTLRAPKMLHYGNSEALDFRVHATAAFINEGRHYISQVNEEGALSPGKFTQQYAEKQMKRRQRCQEKSQLPSTKRQRLILKQERANTQGSCEVLEGKSYESEIGHEHEPDIERIPEAIPRANFKPVLLQKNVEPSLITFDLETTDLIRGRLMPHITQIAATELTSGSVFNNYVLPRVPLTDTAQQVTGITVSMSGQMKVNGKDVKCDSIQAAVDNFLKWSKKFPNAVLIAHNGKRFDYPVFFSTIERLGLNICIDDCFTALIDSLVVFKKCLPGQSSYKQEELVRNVLQVKYDAHNAVADVKSLGQLINHMNVELQELMKYSFHPSAILHSLSSNKAKSENIESLRPLVYNSVMKSSTAENIASSGLNLHHLKKIFDRDGEDGLTVVFTCKNNEGQPRVTSVKKTLEEVLPKLVNYLKQM